MLIRIKSNRIVRLNEMKGKNKILFYGTPDFAVACLEQLLQDGFNIIGVVTAPDKPAGRGKKLQQSDVKKFALENKLDIYQPLNLKSAEFLNTLENLNPDIQVVVAFRMLPVQVWDFPKMGTINLHGSLLPDYRGAAPINWAIINGEKETGVTTFKLLHEIDTGNIAYQQKVTIEADDNFETLYNKLKWVGATLMSKTINDIFNGSIKFLPQVLNGNENKAPKITKSDMEINPSKKAKDIHNLIRGFSPNFGAFTKIDDKIFKIFDSQVTNMAVDELKSDLIIMDNKLLLKTRDFYLEILACQLEGKRRMTAKEFILGSKL